MTDSNNDYTYGDNSKNTLASGKKFHQLISVKKHGIRSSSTDY